jgi:hypothetical protein
MKLNDFKHGLHAAKEAVRFLRDNVEMWCVPPSLPPSILPSLLSSLPPSPPYFSWSLSGVIEAFKGLAYY